MGIFSGIKSTYKFAKGEFVGDLKRNPTTARALKKTKRTIARVKATPKNLASTKLKRGKSLSTEKALNKLRKNAPTSVYKKRKFTKKPIQRIRNEAWSVGLK